MYIQEHFKETRLDVLHGLIRAYPLATVITNDDNGLEANHIPLLLDPEKTGQGLLKGHVARSNTQFERLENGSEVLAIFQGPQSYVSPSWYATKKETRKVVPTWNYAVVHARGQIRKIEAPEALIKILEQLTDQQEFDLSDPWQLTDAPDSFIDQLMQNIVGFEIQLTRLEGKWKVSQNQPQMNRVSVVHGLRLQGGENEQLMADLIEKTIINS